MSLSIKSTNQSRQLSVPELFEVLQLEYIVFELRTKFYPFQKHIDFWQTACEKKKEKILDIAKRNSFPSIFDDHLPNIRKDFERKVIPDLGFPRFLYKNDAQRFMQEKWDILNYYEKRSKVRMMNDEGKMLTGTVLEIYEDERGVRIKIDGTEEDSLFAFEVVSRIL